METAPSGDGVLGVVDINIFAIYLGKSAAKRFDKLLKPWLVEAEDVSKMLANDNGLVARLEGFEPTTLGSEDRCSIR